MSKFGEALARYRNEAGLNQRQLGAAIGLDSTQVNKIERGHRPPLGAKYMKLLVRALQLNQSEAKNLVQLADHSPKVLEVQDEVQTPVLPRILRRKAAKFKRVEVEEGEIEEEEDKDARGEDDQTSTASLTSLVNPALALTESPLDTAYEQIKAIIKSKQFSDEEMERFVIGLIEAAEVISEAVKPQYGSKKRVRP
jgi:transcriptional regulator with XRE-family HTH domain